MIALCLDTSVLVRPLVEEEGSDEAAALPTAGTRLVGPPFAWAEAGSVLRKKVRQELDKDLAREAWLAFVGLPMRTVDGDAVCRRTWDIARDPADFALYDVAFVAAAERSPFGPCDLVTAGRAFYERAKDRYPCVRLLA